VTSTQSWGNGTLALTGNLIVNAGATLTLWNMVLALNPSNDQQYHISLSGGALVVRGGTLTTANPAYGWSLQTTSDAGALVDLSGTNVSYAGSGSTSGFLLLGGNGHRFRHLRVTNSALGSSSGVVDVNGLGISDVRVENSTFTNTGPAYYVHAAAAGANLVFADNAITGYVGGASALFAESTQVLGNSMDVGGSDGVTLWGGGPGWPAKNAYNVSGNTITTTGYAITSSHSLGYDITWNHILGGHISLDGSGNRFAYNNVSGTDERIVRTHVVWTSANSSFDHNTIWGADLTGDSGFVVINYGNVKVTDNNLFLNCYGDNCMGIEVINVIPSYQPIFPGFPTVEVARNRVTWTTIASGGLTIFLDNEYSERVWLHDNVEAVVPGTGTPTSSLQGGGVRDSVYENNTVLGPTTWCIYEYIDSAANNLFQNNRCDRGQYGGIFQTGGNVYRGNVFTNLTGPGIWICPNGSCAGAPSTNTSNNAWYNNTFTFASATPDLTLMSLGNALYNTFLGHGATHWTDGASQYPVYGDWLFWANAAITRVAYADDPLGHRTLTVTAGGRTYADREAPGSVTDSATITVDGAIDSQGSLYGGTVLRSLSARGNSSVVVQGLGSMTFTMSGFLPNYTYNVTLDNLGTGVSSDSTITMDATGSAQLGVDFGATTSQRSLTLWGSFPAPPGDTTPPAQVLDLGNVSVGPGWAILRWTAPGNDGTVGQASAYDFRYSTSGPLDGSNFFLGTHVTTPLPGPPGSTETVNVTGLAPSTTYWFALRTSDNVPNWSPISDNAEVITASAPRPAVQSADVNASSGRVDIAFSIPMDRASVGANLKVSGGTPYHLTWVDDRHVQVVFDTGLASGATYTVTLGSTTTSQQGVTLGSAYVYTFVAPTSPTNPTGPPPGPGVAAPSVDSNPVLLLAAVLVAWFVVFHVYREDVLTTLRSVSRWRIPWRRLRTWKGAREPPRKPPPK
jgi:hypothetical protein